MRRLGVVAMSEDPADPKDGLSFQKAEFAEAQAAACTRCQQPLEGAYYLVGGVPTCERCKLQHELDQANSSGSSRFLRAFAFGLGAAVAGSAIWYAVRATTGYEIGLIAIVVGLMVGGAVRAGSGHRGGPLYQALAILLTYGGICAQYVPDIVKAIREMPDPQQAPAASPAAGTPVTTEPAPAAPATTQAGAPTLPMVLMAFAAVFALALASPFLGGFQNIIGILIIGFALWEAWKMNRRVPIEVEGPFRLGAEGR
jgi:hypothetical protein